MKKRTLSSLLLSYILLLTLIFIPVLLSLITSPCVLYAKDTYPELPEIDAPNYILMDADSGYIFCEKNSDEKCYPASVTKLMTALVVLDNCNPSDTLIVSSNAVKSVKYGDANAALKKDEEFTIEQALNIMLIKSANDMAYALGEHVGGSVANFTNMMNKKAKEIGCLNTHFSNASGLTDINHYTTAYDMALICQAVIDKPEIMNATSYAKTYSCPPTNKTSDTRYYKSANKMITGEYKYPYCIGSKTGYTDAAGHTLASFSNKDGLRLICIIFNSTDNQRYEDTISLFDYAYNNFSRHNIFEHQNELGINDGFFFKSLNITGNALLSASRLGFTLPVNDYVILPNEMTIDDLEKRILFDKENTQEGFASIEFYNNGHYVGKTTLLTSDYDTLTENPSNLPYMKEFSSLYVNTNDIIIGGRFINVNIWLLIGGVCIIILIIIFIIIQHNKRRTLTFK